MAGAFSSSTLGRGKKPASLVRRFLEARSYIDILNLWPILLPLLIASSGFGAFFYFYKFSIYSFYILSIEDHIYLFLAGIWLCFIWTLFLFLITQVGTWVCFAVLLPLTVAKNCTINIFAVIFNLNQDNKNLFRGLSYRAAYGLCLFILLFFNFVVLLGFFVSEGGADEFQYFFDTIMLGNAKTYSDMDTDNSGYIAMFFYYIVIIIMLLTHYYYDVLKFITLIVTIASILCSPAIFVYSYLSSFHQRQFLSIRYDKEELCPSEDEAEAKISNRNNENNIKYRLEYKGRYFHAHADDSSVLYKKYLSIIWSGSKSILVQCDLVYTDGVSNSEKTRYSSIEVIFNPESIRSAKVTVYPSEAPKPSDDKNKVW